MLFIWSNFLPSSWKFNDKKLHQSVLKIAFWRVFCKWFPHCSILLLYCPSASSQYFRGNCFKFHLTYSIHYLRYHLMSTPTNVLRHKSPIRRIKISSNWLLTDNFGKWTVFTQTLILLAVTPLLLSPWLLTLQCHTYY